MVVPRGDMGRRWHACVGKLQLVGPSNMLIVQCTGQLENLLRPSVVPCASPVVVYLRGEVERDLKCIGRGGRRVGQCLAGVRGRPRNPVGEMLA